MVNLVEKLANFTMTSDSPPPPISYLDYFYFRIYKLGKMGLFLRKKIEVN